jgi:hypothetical protein
MKTIKNLKKRMWALVTPAQANENEISFFDVKELYDAAFAEKDKARANIKRYNALMTQAEALDAAYRAQLTAKRSEQYRRAA